MLAQVETDLALADALDQRVGRRVDEDDREPRQRLAHRARLDCGARRVADLGTGLGLAVAVADRQAPRRAPLLDDLGVQRLARADHLPERARTAGEVGLDQHPPDRWRRAERGHLVLA